MIRIVIAEDQQMILGVLGSLLDLEEDMQVVGMARNGEEAISLVHQYQPDVCIMDIYMPGKNGLEAAELLNRIRDKGDYFNHFWSVRQFSAGSKLRRKRLFIEG